MPMVGKMVGRVLVRCRTCARRSVCPLYGRVFDKCPWYVPDSVVVRLPKEGGGVKND